MQTVIQVIGILMFLAGILFLLKPRSHKADNHFRTKGLSNLFRRNAPHCNGDCLPPQCPPMRYDTRNSCFSDFISAFGPADIYAWAQLKSAVF